MVNTGGRVKPWVAYAEMLGPFRGYHAPRTFGRVLQVGLRDLGLLFVTTLPMVLVLTVATLEVLDVFKLRRMVASWFVFGLEWPWELGVMISGPLALSLWTLLIGLLLVPPLLLLLKSTEHYPETGKYFVKRFVKTTLSALGIGIMASFPALAIFTVVMIIFALTWLVPTGLLLLTVLRMQWRQLSWWVLIPPAILAAALHVGWVWAALDGLAQAGLTSARVIAVDGIDDRMLQTMRFSADGKQLLLSFAVGPAQTALEVETGRLLPAPPAPAASATGGSFAGDARYVLTDGMEITLEGEAIVFERLRDRKVVQGHYPMKTKAIALSPDGTRLASCGTDNVVRLWRPSDGKHEKTLWGHSHDVVAVTFSPDGRYLASASVDGTVRLWDHFR